jgi:hypothetical protein
LAAFTAQDLQTRYPNLEFLWVDQKDDTMRELSKARVGREIWKFFFILTLLCLLVESILASQWAPKE